MERNILLQDRNKKICRVLHVQCVHVTHEIAKTWLIITYYVDLFVIYMLQVLENFILFTVEQNIRVLWWAREFWIWEKLEFREGFGDETTG